MCRPVSCTQSVKVCSWWSCRNPRTCRSSRSGEVSNWTANVTDISDSDSIRRFWQDGRYFRLERVALNGEATLDPGFAVLVLLTGDIDLEDGRTVHLTRG